METVRKFVEISAKSLGWIDKKSKKSIIWEGEGLNEVGRRADTGEIVVKIDPRYFRATEVNELLGDSSKAKTKLGWETKISLETLVSEMIKNDKKIADNEVLIKTKSK